VKGLIITADDFGAAVEVNEAVEVAHYAGVLTAASLMVTGRSVADAIARTRRLTSLRVGLHLVLIDGRPVSPASSIPDLVRSDGRFRSDMTMLGAEMFLRPKVRRQVATEIAAQFEAFQATGLALDHVNAHKHFHLHPTISGLILEIGRRFGIRAARVPAEPRTILALAEPGMKSRSDYVLLPWAAILKSRFEKAGLLVPQSVFGLAWSGAMTARRLAALLQHLPPGLNEIYLHPATSDSFEGAAPGYHYAEEFAALTAPSTIEEVRRTRARLGGFADFDAARALA